MAIFFAYDSDFKNDLRGIWTYKMVGINDLQSILSWKHHHSEEICNVVEINVSFAVLL